MRRPSFYSRLWLTGQEEVEAKTRSDRLAEVKAKALVDALADWPTAELQPEELIERLVKVKAEALLNALPNTLPEEVAETQKDT